MITATEKFFVETAAIAPIAITELSLVARIKNYQATRLTVQTSKTTADGFHAVRAMESENHFGPSVAGLLEDIFVARLLPLLFLIWCGICVVWNWANKPETKTVVTAKWTALKTWLAPKFDYKRDIEV